MKRIASLSDLRRELVKIFHSVKEGKIDPKRASSAGYIAQLLLATFQAEAAQKPEKESPALLELVNVLDKLRKEAGIVSVVGEVEAEPAA